MKKLIWAIALACAITSAPATAKKATMTPLELQAIQSREFEVDKGTAFGAVMTVIQDLGYTVSSADVQSGFITAASPNKNKTGFFDALGGISASGNTMVTAFLMQMPSGSTRVRLNFVNTKNSSTAWGRDTREDKPILEAEPYNNAWERIDEALFVLGALNAPTPLPAPETVTEPNDEPAITTAPDEAAEGKVDAASAPAN